MNTSTLENDNRGKNTSSKVSGFLLQELAPVIQECITSPALHRSFPAALPLITTVNKAHILMLMRCGIITGETARKLAQGVLQIESEGVEGFELNPALEDPYFNYEAKIIEMVGSETGGQLHTARSRNDLKSTMDRLRARTLCLRVLEDLFSLRETMVTCGEQFKDVIMPGYTHLQPAQPITFGYYLLGVAYAIGRDWQRIAECYARINMNPLGAGAFAGVTFPIDRQMTTQLLGFDAVTDHSLDAVASRDYLIELISNCTLLTSNIGRMAQDFYVMTSFEFQTLQLPDSVAITSSIMPQKKNMTALEILKGRVAQATGALVTVLAGYKATPFSHMLDGSQEGLRWAWDALEEIALSLPVARFIVENAEPRRERMLELVHSNFSTITDLADALVNISGLSFRESHHVAGRTARLALDQGLRSDQITAEHVAAASDSILGRKITLDQAVVEDILDPAQAVERRAGSGSPAAKDIAMMLSNLKLQLDQDLVFFKQRRNKVTEAHHQLEMDFASVAQEKGLS